MTSLKSIGISSLAAMTVVAVGTSSVVLADAKRGKDVKSRQAERQAGDSYKAIGMRAGSFKLKPSLEIDGEYSLELWTEFKKERRNALRIAERSSFLLSSEVTEAVEKMETGLSNARNAVYLSGNNLLTVFCQC